jgi:site-specific DNA recombinase
MTTVGIYVRLSQDRDGKATSPQRQEADCRRLAKSRGWRVGRVYSDRDLSGFSGVRRPDFEEMLADVRRGNIAGVVAWKLDRLARNRKDYGRLLDLVEAGAELALVQDPVDTTTPLGGVVLDLLASMARMESETISTRVRSALSASARAGRPHASGGRVWGYTLDREVIDAEAETIRDVARRILAGESLGSIARHLNSSGVLTCRGNSWSTANLGRAIRAAHLAGLRRHHDDLHVGTWTPILDRETWQRVRDTLDRNKHRGGGTRRHLLSGIARCGRCGNGLSASQTGAGVRRYACHPNSSGCGRLGIIAEPLEEHVSAGVRSVLDGPGLDRMLAGRPSGIDPSVELELSEAQRRLDELAADFAEARITRREWMVARDAISALVSRLSERLRTDLSTPVLRAISGHDLDSWWNAATVEERRAVIQAVIGAITVDPPRRGGAGFDAGRVRVEWAA